MAVYEFQVFVDRDPAAGGEAVVVKRDIFDYPPERIAEAFRRNGVLVGPGDWVPGERVARVRWRKT